MFMSPPLMLAEQQLTHLAGPGHRPLRRVDAGGLQLGRRRGRGQEVRDGVHTADTSLAGIPCHYTRDGVDIQTLAMGM